MQPQESGQPLGLFAFCDARGKLNHSLLAFADNYVIDLWVIKKGLRHIRTWGPPTTTREEGATF